MGVSRREMSGRRAGNRTNDALAGVAAWSARLKERQASRSVARRMASGTVEWAARATYHLWRNRRYLTARKLANMGLVRLQALLQTERVVGRPYQVKIEPTNICNSKCRLCPTGIGIRGRARMHMDLDAFKGIIDSIRPYATTLDLGNWGDPLLHPDIFEMIRYAERSGIWTYASTNLHALEPGQGEKLVRSGLNRLACSLHGASQETYETYQPEKDFEATLAKLRTIVEAKRRLYSRLPEIWLVMVLMKFNEHEKEAFERLAHSLGCKPIVLGPSVNARLFGFDRDLNDLHWTNEMWEKRTREALEHWMPEDRRYVMEPYKLMEMDRYSAAHYNGRKLNPCHTPWSSMIINCDGGVTPCAGVFESKHDLGNVFEQPLAKIWNSPSYRACRRSFRRSTEACEGIANPCRECSGFCV